MLVLTCNILYIYTYYDIYIHTYIHIYLQGSFTDTVGFRVSGFGGFGFTIYRGPQDKGTCPPTLKAFLFFVL